MEGGQDQQQPAHLVTDRALELAKEIWSQCVEGYLAEQMEVFKVEAVKEPPGRYMPTSSASRIETGSIMGGDYTMQVQTEDGLFLNREIRSAFDAHRERVAEIKDELRGRAGHVRIVLAAEPYHNFFGCLWDRDAERLCFYMDSESAGCKAVMVV